MKGVFLGACLERHFNYDIVYNDIVDLPGIDLVCDMTCVDLSSYDFLLASPPCNYYSRANYRRDISPYAVNTKFLLPYCIKTFALSGKPFLIENVRNYNLFKSEGIFDLCDKLGVIVYFYGRHTYFTNVFINFNGIKQEPDFHNRFYAKKHNLKIERQSYRQGGDNVFRVFEYWLECVVND